ncbi:hypothetical protein AAG906_012132 [Vitis piasezkii]
MALFAAMSYTPLSLSLSRLRPPTNHRRFSPCLASVSSSSHESSPPPPPPSPPTETILSSNPPSKPLVESSRPLNSTFNYALPDPKASPVVRGVSGTLIPSPCGIDVRFYNHHVLPLWVLCKYNILVMFDMCFEPHASMTPLSLPMGFCVKGIHTGKMVLRLVEAIDVYLAGTVMLIFGMGLYGLFISNVPPDVPPSVDRALKGSSLFGMFALKRSKMVTIATGMDLLSYSVCIFLSSASLYILNNLHKAE